MEAENPCVSPCGIPKMVIKRSISTSMMVEGVQVLYTFRLYTMEECVVLIGPTKTLKEVKDKDPFLLGQTELAHPQGPYIPREVVHSPKVAHPVCTTGQGPNVKRPLNLSWWSWAHRMPTLCVVLHSTGPALLHLPGPVCCSATLWVGRTADLWRLMGREEEGNYGHTIDLHRPSNILEHLCPFHLQTQARGQTFGRSI